MRECHDLQVTKLQVACSRRSASGARAKNKASERAGLGDFLLNGRCDGMSLAIFFARAPLPERLEQAKLQALICFTVL